MLSTAPFYIRSSECIHAHYQKGYSIVLILLQETVLNDYRFERKIGNFIISLPKTHH
jgi:hypothetical protein